MKTAVSALSCSRDSIILLAQISRVPEMYETMVQFVEAIGLVVLEIPLEGIVVEEKDRARIDGWYNIKLLVCCSKEREEEWVRRLPQGTRRFTSYQKDGKDDNPLPLGWD